MRHITHYLTIAIFASILAAPAHAEKPTPENIFTGTEFLTWERKNQEFYIQTSIGMAALIVAQYSQSQAKCVSDSFNEEQKDVYEHVLDAVKKFPDYHPRGTILAVLEKKCGEFSNG